MSGVLAAQLFAAVVLIAVILAATARAKADLRTQAARLTAEADAFAAKLLADARATTPAAAGPIRLTVTFEAQPGADASLVAAAVTATLDRLFGPPAGEAAQATSADVEYLRRAGVRAHVGSPASGG